MYCTAMCAGISASPEALTRDVIHLAWHMYTHIFTHSDEGCLSSGDDKIELFGFILSLSKQSHESHVLNLLKGRETRQSRDNGQVPQAALSCIELCKFSLVVVIWLQWCDRH